MAAKSSKIIIKKVKKGGHGGHHGGSWKVAYADFVTAMMAFFLLMWLLNMSSAEKRAKLSYYFKTFSLFEK
ncbi:MAG: chemotaxis protein, partial [Thermodesulfovibrio sp.]|nr:chemotaxis protein [Thermodesulfovibrio sp.]